MSFSTTPKYLYNKELVEKLLDKTGSAVVPKIIDVRDPEEFRDSHIKGAINCPSEKWEDISYVDSIIDQCQFENEVVVHCFYSQQRGPTCTRILLQRLKERVDVTHPPDM